MRMVTMRKRLRDLYLELLARHGHQRWWPADTKYEVVVGAILTQNTSWKNVERAIACLKASGRLLPHAILDMQTQELETLIRSSGYYRQKAERLKLASEKWLELRRSRLGTNDLRKQWLSVRGIGRETADTILLYALERPVFVIDAYTRLFCSHHSLFEAREYDAYKCFFESNLPSSVPLFKEYHALIVEWAKANKNRQKEAGHRARNTGH